MRESAGNQSTVMAGRGVQLFLVAVMGMAFVGFVVGLRQGVPIYEPADLESAPVSPRGGWEGRGGDAIPATAYQDFDRRLQGPNAQWRSTLADLAQPDPDILDPIEWDEEARAILRAARAFRRGFEGAPPTVPHPIDQMSSASCLSCHATGKAIGNTYAPAMSHELLHNCTQCHVEQESSKWTPGPGVRNTFMPHDGPLLGARAWPGAPPTVPHTTVMRENCMSCHGPQGPQAIRTTHPWRANCMQCHAPSAERDQVLFGHPGGAGGAGGAGGGEFLPPPPVERP
jgi:nitrate reductase (cytochrome), electron transfer subunit